MPRRSVLFSPADQGDKLEGALRSAADAVVFDLEDGVAPDDKPSARETIVEILSTTDSAPVEVLIRLNPIGAGGRDDISVLQDVAGGTVPDGFVLPKVDGRSTVHHFRGRIRDAGFDADLWCLLESPAGVLAASEIASARGVSAVVFGGEDYMAAVGGQRTESSLELLYARQRTVAAASAAGIDAIDGITTAIDDTDRVTAEATEAATFGFDGKLAIHPAQLDPINEAFAPSDEEVAWATRVLDAVESSDSGVLRVDGEMIDAPLIKRAEQILDATDRT